MRIFTLLLCLLISVTTTLHGQSRATPVDGFAAEVDGKIITVGDVVELVRPSLIQVVNQYSGAELLEKQTQLFDQGLDKLIEQSLMVAQFNKLEAEFPASSVRERKETIMRERFGNSREQLISALRQIGKTEQSWEDDIREQLIIQSMIQQFVRSKIHVSPREIREAYENRKSELNDDIELKLRSIAFKPASGDAEEKRQSKIQNVMKQLSDGIPFEDVARSFSEGPKAQEGGDEGWVNLSGLPEELKQALSDRQPGDLTPLIETPFQSFIFKVEGRRGGETISLAKAQPAIERELEAQKYEAAYERWIEGLYDQFQVRRFKPDISAVTGEL